MKKFIGLIIIVMIALGSNQSDLKAGIAGTGTHTVLVTAYYCLNGAGRCLTFQGSGNIFLTIPGILHTTQIRVPVGNIVPSLDPGVTEHYNLFLYTNNPSELTGKGIKDGLLRYTDQNFFEVYDVDDQIEFTNYSSWYQAVQ